MDIVHGINENHPNHQVGNLFCSADHFCLHWFFDIPRAQAGSFICLVAIYCAVQDYVNFSKVQLEVLSGP